MGKLRLLSTVMMLLGAVSFLAGVFISRKEFMEYGVCIGVAGIIGYAVIFIMSSFSAEGRKSIFD